MPDWDRGVWIALVRSITVRTGRNAGLEADRKQE